MKALGFPSWSSAGLVDDMGAGISRQGLEGMMGVEELKRGKFVRDRWGRAMRNSSAMGISSSRFNEVSSF